MGNNSMLASQTGLSVAFKAGKSALGHHWVLFEGKQEIGQTKLAYEGGMSKTLGRLGRATGMVTKGETNAEVLDGSGAVQYRLASHPKPARVELTDTDGAVVGEARRDGRTLTLHAPGVDAPLATITRPEDKEVKQFPIVAADGSTVGVLSTEYVGQSQLSKVEQVASVVELVDFFTMGLHGGSFQATMHLGFLASREYHSRLDADVAEPLRTLVVLSPLLAAYVF